MNSPYSPPIEERSTEELLKIIETPVDWREDALSKARIELTKRGFPIPKQKRREKSQKQFENRINGIKSKASFTRSEKLVLFLMAPIILSIKIASHSEFIPIPSGKSTWELKSEGFEKKWKQRLSLILTGNLFWLFILILYLELFS